MNEATFVLTPTPPFDLAQSLAFIGEFPPMRGEQSLREERLTRAIRLHGKAFGFVVTMQGTPDLPQLNVRILSNEPPSTEDIEALEDRIGFFLSIHDDLRPLYHLAQDDAPFNTVLRRAYGYHQVKFMSAFENTVWAMLTQRTPLAIAASIKAKLVEAYGGNISVNETVFPAFPEANDFGDVSHEDLLPLIGNERKTDYVLAAIQAFQTVDEHWLRTGNTDEVEAWLRSIKGIGVWSASFVMLRGLGRMEQLIISEENSAFNAEMLRAAKKVYGEQITLKEVAAIAVVYGDHAGYWAHTIRAFA